MEAVIFGKAGFTIAILIGVSAATVGWFGVWVAMLTALGNKRWAWGISMALLGPVTAIPYTIIYRNKEAEYPSSLMIKAVIVLVLTGIYLYFAYSTQHLIS